MGPFSGLTSARNTIFKITGKKSIKMCKEPIVYTTNTGFNPAILSMNSNLTLNQLGNFRTAEFLTCTADTS